MITDICPHGHFWLQCVMCYKRVEVNEPELKKFNMKKSEKEKKEELSKKLDEAKRHYELKELQEYRALFKEFKIPGSSYDPLIEMNGYVMMPNANLLRSVLQEWQQLKQAEDITAAKEEIERWQNRVKKLEQKLKDIRRVVG